ncbi:hypothetical protein BJV82DRAFT_616260, partial [Fennellomyces sp. T-0311]
MACKYHLHSHKNHQSGLPSPGTLNGTAGIPPVNLTGDQCTWCGKYGHKRKLCPYL